MKNLKILLAVVSFSTANQLSAMENTSIIPSIPSDFPLEMYAEIILRTIKIEAGEETGSLAAFFKYVTGLKLVNRTILQSLKVLAKKRTQQNSLAVFYEGPFLSCEQKNLLAYQIVNAETIKLKGDGKANMSFYSLRVEPLKEGILRIWVFSPPQPCLTRGCYI